MNLGERASVSSSWSRVKQVEAGTATFWQWSSFFQQPRHNSKVVSHLDFVEWTLGSVVIDPMHSDRLRLQHFLEHKDLSFPRSIHCNVGHVIVCDVIIALNPSFRKNSFKILRATRCRTSYQTPINARLWEMKVWFLEMAQKTKEFFIQRRVFHQSVTKFQKWHNDIYH